MKIIISPAKKMEECQDCLPAGELPHYLDRTEIVYRELKNMAEAELKELFRANDRITHENYLRYRSMDLSGALTPALLSYVGIQYQYMAPKLFSWNQWEYVKQHLRILSGFYGVLRPDDRVTPYRLEMQAKLRAEGRKDLYEFWGERLYKRLEEEEGGAAVILNLASKEYSKAVEPYLAPDVRFVTCVFGEVSGDKVKVKATEAKMARGEMVRWMAERGIGDVDGIREFGELGYCFTEELSDVNRFVYIKDAGNGR